MVSSLSRFRTCTLVLLLILIIAEDAAAQRVSNAVDGADYFSDYGRAPSLYADGRYVEAARMLSDLAVRNPDDASIWFWLGRSRELLDDTAAASAMLDRFLESVHVVKIGGRSYRLRSTEKLQSDKEPVEKESNHHNI